jgi:hypothetical protein
MNASRTCHTGGCDSPPRDPRLAAAGPAPRAASNRAAASRGRGTSWVARSDLRGIRSAARFARIRAGSATRSADWVVEPRCDRERLGSNHPRGQPIPGVRMTPGRLAIEMPPGQRPRQRVTQIRIPAGSQWRRPASIPHRPRPNPRAVRPRGERAREGQGASVHDRVGAVHSKSRGAGVGPSLALVACPQCSHVAAIRNEEGAGFLDPRAVSASSAVDPGSSHRPGCMAVMLSAFEKYC